MKNIDFVFDEASNIDIIKGMILESIAKTIKESGKSRYQISKDTGIDNAVLCRIVSGGSCSIETADILCKYLGLRISKKGGAKMKRHKYREGEATATFEELSFQEQAKSITATVNVLGRMIDNNVRRAAQKGKEPQKILEKRLQQIQRMIDKRR